MTPEIRDRRYVRLHLIHSSICVSLSQDALLSTQVKREEIEESASAQAHLESAASSLSADILQYRSRLADFKEALECCICLERTVR